ncbi:MAG: methyltransferase domain-containing protein [Betaproteobacteria bacterium]|nr:methyltransferase domain-containing protein [Betaproteobacteria bacterium]
MSWQEQKQRARLFLRRARVGLRKRYVRVPDGLRQSGALVFRCNICGAESACMADAITRESGDCIVCDANLRFRSIAAVLSERLFGEVRVLDELAPRRDIVGLGMSDALIYADPLARKFSYINTYYHRSPRLDITDPDPRWRGTNDFVISSDVFEHVGPPVQRAFDNLFALLKPGGVAIFSVPYSLEADSVEHFPRLHQFSLTKSAGQWRLENITAEGEREQFDNLIFHGGPGSTLEMRVFSLEALKRHFHAAGFVDVRVHDKADPAHGIVWREPWGITMSALRP